MKIWFMFVVLAGICWGTYVPLIAYGGRELHKNAYAGFLCVGAAYFLIAVLFPLGLFWAQGSFPAFTGTGVTFATLAGVAGALGALCVIFATKFDGPRIFVGPVIFALAPVINTLVSLVWHPSPESVIHFELRSAPDWKLYVGIILAGLGAFLVLYSKEEAEASHAALKARPAAAVADSNPGAPS